MIGADYNEEALRATEHTLAHIPHIVLKGDVADPGQMIEDLKRRGIVDPENILHVRSFLDHDRPYRSPANISAARSRLGFPYQGVYVDSQGGGIAQHDMAQSLVEHLERWSAAAGKHGLIIAEVHCLAPDTVNRFLDESESLHFDAYHAFSNQHLVEAEAFVMSAAEAGLFPRPGFSRKFPAAFPFTRITINWFEKRPYAIRHARLDDLPELVRLEEKCWPEPLRTSPQGIQSRIERFPAGHCVLEMDGRIAGVIYSQRLATVDSLRDSNSEMCENLHTPEGTVIHLLGISVDPEFQDQALGDQLLECMLQRATLISGVDRVVGVTRCRSFGQHRDEPMEVYAHSRDKNGLLLDPILRFHEKHGAAITRIIPGYRPGDEQNGGNGVLVEYDLGRRQASAVHSLGSSLPLKEEDDEGRAPSVRTVIHECVHSLMGQESTDVFSPDRPLRDMGFDSLDLMGLRYLLSRHLGEQLDPTFFFRYPTPESIVGYFEGNARSRLPNVSSYTGQSVGSASVRLSNENVEWNSTAKAAGSPYTSDTLVDRDYSVDAVAIIGISCRFPNGANGTDKYWSLLREGRDAITEVPETRWDHGRIREIDPDDSTWQSTRFGGFLDQIDRFDAQFFRIAPIEANDTDPQQRILLETAWEALENAGINPQGLKHSQTGIFVGISSHDYEILQLRQKDEAALGPYFATGNSASVGAGRLSYFFGFQGPAISVDTACSSSLVSVHLACRSLLQGECDLALAGGVNLILTPEISITYAKAGMLSRDGRCKTFDQSADGYVRSEGCGLIVLKRLDRAVYDNDNVLAVIRGSSVNQDGPSNGLTAPNGFSQEAVIRSALEAAGVSPGEVSYVETHGTGTSLGDPVEVKALDAVYGPGRPRDRPLVIGSVKTNIGHAEAASGIAGLIKVVLSLLNNFIPPHLHFKQLNPLISLDAIPAVIPSAGLEWENASEKPRLAAVSSFGSSGTNCHLIVEEAPVSLRASTVPDKHSQLFVLSARNEEELGQLAKSFLVHLRSRPKVPLANMCQTLGAGRAHFEHRIAVVAESVDQLLGQLDDFVSDAPEGAWAYGRTSEGQHPGLAFLFTGQGSQYTGMGRELFETERQFRRALETCDEILRPSLGIPLLDVLYPEPGAPSPLDQTVYTQPCLFAVEYALSELWKSWGIEPSAVMGHSVGEYVAACIAGVFSLEDGLKLISARARLMQSLPGNGKMVVLFADEKRVARAIEPYAREVSIAAINGPGNTVISGRRESVNEIATRLEEEGLQTFPLAVSHAFHSPLMEPMLEEFSKIASEVSYSSPRISLISNITGQPATHEIAGPAYWCAHIRRPVQFEAGINTLHRMGHVVFLEIGPKPVLVGMGCMCLPDEVSTGKRSQLKWLPSLCQGVSDRQQIMQSLGQLYVCGQPIDWKGLDGGAALRKLCLPTYPWQRERYWFEEGADRRKSAGFSSRRPGAQPRHPLLNNYIKSSIHPNLHLWETEVSPESFPWIADHLLDTRIIFPAAAFLEMARAAAEEAFGPGASDLGQVEFADTLFLDEEKSKTIQVVIAPDSQQGLEFKILSLNEQGGSGENNWSEHARGKVFLKDGVKDLLYKLEWRQRPLAGKISSASSLPSPEEIKQHVQSTSLGMMIEADLKNISGLALKLESLSIAYVIEALQNLGFRFDRNRMFSLDSLRTDLKVDPRHYKFLTYLLWYLEEEGLLSRSGDEWRVMREPPVGDPRTLWLDLFQNHHECSIELKLLRRCGENLANVLAGRVSPLELLFPGGSTVDAEALYGNSAFSRNANRRLVAAVSAAIEHSTADQSLRVLEIGAGTGGMTSRILPLLPHERASFVFTDVGLLFLSQAKEKFKKFPFMQYAVLDIERDPFEQGFQPRQFDLVLAANCLHATHSIHRTLSNVLKLLAPNGLSMFIEGTSPRRWVDLIFGMTEGWWLFEDYHLRPNHPLLGSEEWKQVCREVGLLNATVVGEDIDVSAELYHQAIVLAQAPKEVSPANKIASKMPRNDECWLIFSDERGFGVRLAEALRHRGAHCSLVSKSSKYERRDDHYGIDPMDLDHYQRLVIDFVSFADSPLKRVIYLWALDEELEETSSSRELSESHGRVCGGALLLCQTLVRFGGSPPPQLWLCTRQVQPTGREVGELNLADSALSGLAKVIELEHPELECRQVDLDLTDQKESITQLLDELEGNDGESQIVYRDGLRFVSRLEESRDQQGATKTLHCQSEGSYLITGGLGRLGLKVARWMAEQGARHIVLLGRKGLSDGPDPSLDGFASQKLEAVRSIESLGASVKVVPMDVSDWARMSSLFKQFGQSEPPLKGVVHASAVIDPVTLRDLDMKTFEAAFRPKALGAWVLHQLTRDMDLDFFVLFSSGASIWGSKDLAHYAAANQFLDTLAHYRRNRGLPGLSINWGWWAGGGTTREMDRYFQQIGLVPMDDGECLEALSGCLTSGAVQRTVSRFDWNTFGSIMEARKHRPLLERAFIRNCKKNNPLPQEGVSFSRRLEESPPDRQWDLLLAHIRSVVGQVLGIDRPDLLDSKQGFFSMGMDSIMSVQLKSRLEASLEKILPRTAAFEYPNIMALATYIAEDVLKLKLSSQSANQRSIEDGFGAVAGEDAELSEEELEELLSEKLKNLQH